jgi:predicted  nucleic acid-binding Zn-ribbon protein
MGDDHPLLEVQRLDSSADALRASRAGLPERAALRERESELAALAHQREEAGTRRVALAREERGLETAVADLEARAREVEKTLYAGKVTAPRELEALQLELRDFQRRQGEREDEELALMEQQERVDAEIAAMDARHQKLEAQAAELRAAIAAAESKIDAELGRLREARAAIAPELPPALLAVYDKLRALPRLAGRVVVGVAGGTCSGCNVALPITLASRIQSEPRGDTVQCPQCHRILVH